MNRKILLFVFSLLAVTQLAARTRTYTLHNNTNCPVQVQFPLAGSIDPAPQMVKPHETAEYKAKFNSHGIRIISITLPGGKIIGGSVKNPALEEHFGVLGRACSFTWDLISVEKKGQDVPAAMKFSLYRKPCGGIKGSLYPGGLIKETKWINISSDILNKKPLKEGEKR